MKPLMTATTLVGTTSLAALAMALPAYAGGLERTTQSVGVLFEEGRYLEFGAVFGSPNVSGVGPDNVGAPTGLVPTGNITDNFLDFSAAYKADLNDKWSYAVIFDQPFGADVDYAAGTGNAFAGSNAELNSNALTGLIQYNFGNGASVYGGVRAQTLEAVANITIQGATLAGPLVYTADGSSDLSFGYVAGVAYEKPEIALRVALTYNSSIDHDLDTSETILGLPPLEDTVTEIETPESLNLEFQSGVAEDTLVFGSIRYVDTSATEISPANFPANPLVFFEDNRTSYTLGVGHRLNETWSVLGSIGYENTTGSITGNLGPTDGFTSYGVGAVYTKGNMKITGGVRYIDIGEATTTVNAVFDDNDAIVAGIRIGYNF